LSSNEDKPIKVARLVRRYQNKKQAKTRQKFIFMPFKLVFGLILFVISIYFAIQCYNALNTPMKTASALSTVVTDEFSSVGYFFRSEKVIDAEYNGILEYTVSDGDRVGRFAPYASVYLDSAAVETNKKIATAEERITALEAALSASGDTSSASDLSSRINEQLLNVAEISDSGVFTRISSSEDTLKSLIVTRDFSYTDTTEIESLIASLKRNRDVLKSNISERETVLYTPYAGYFMSNVDGFEELYKTSELKSLSVDEVKALDEIDPPSSEDSMGKIITGFDWYFVTVLRRSEAENLTTGSTVNLRFDATGDINIKAQVHSIGNYADDETVVVLYGDKYAEDLMSFRKQAVRIVLNEYEGLKVPKEAVRVNADGEMGVYVITGTYAEFKKIDVVYETRDYYVVDTDPTNKRSLLLYDEIIVSAKGLSSGKVIK